MNKNFKEGEYVHVPEGVVGYTLGEEGSVKNYIKFTEPKLLMYLGECDDPHFGGDSLCKLFYEGEVYSLHKHDVYAREELNG